MNSFKKIILTTSIILTLGTTTVARADEQYNGGIIDQLKQANSYWANLPKLIQDSVGLMLQNLTYLMFQPVPDIGKTVATFSSLGRVLQDQNKLTNENTDFFNNVFLGTAGENNDTDQAVNSYKQAKYRNDVFGDNPSDNAANQFFSPTKYNAATQKTARDYAGYASGAALSLSQNNVDTNSASGLEKSVDYKTITAIQSLNNYNFSKLYASRSPIATNSIKSLSDINVHGGTISAQQLFNYLAMHKATDPQWYTQMQTASPFTAIRELLNFSAGIFMELHQMEQNQEQILATLSAQNTLMIMMEQQIQKQNGH